MKRTLFVAFVLAVGLFAALAAHAGGDITPPVLVDAKADRQQIDTTFAPQTVTFTLHITDDLSGVKGVHVGLRHEHGYNTSRECQSWPDNVSTGATLECSVTWPRYSAEGKWLVTWLWMIDAVGNSTEGNVAECSQSADGRCLQYVYNAKATAAIRSMEIQVGTEADPHIFLPLVR